MLGLQGAVAIACRATCSPWLIEVDGEVELQDLLTASLLEESVLAFLGLVFGLLGF